MKLMQNRMEFVVHPVSGRPVRRIFEVETLSLGRAANRDIEASRRDAEKIRAEGYDTYDPPNVCKKSRYLLTNEDTIEVQERRTFAEVEYVMMLGGGRNTLVTAGSDHNDGTLLWVSTPALGKLFDSAKDKQTCPAVVARDAWLYDDVKDHWDELRLRSHVVVSGKKILLQDFQLSNLVPPEFYFKKFPFLKKKGTVMFSGSFHRLPSVPKDIFSYEKGGVFPDNFHFEFYDPVLKRSFSHGYKVNHLEYPEYLTIP